MSEAKGAEGKGKGKKKGGKLPIILVSVLVVAGGGFFISSKGKKEEKPKEPKVELGEVVTVPDEILVNVGGDSRTFLACKVAFQLRKPDPDVKDDHVSITDPAAGGGHAATDPTYSIVRNAVYDVLMSKKIDDLTKPDGMKVLKREIALAVNHAVHTEDPEKKEEDPKAKWEKEKKAQKEGDSHGGAGEHGSGGHGGEIDHEWLDELGFDSDSGPVLKVLFTEFVWQKY